MDKNSLKLIKKDLLTLSDQDLDILYKVYNISDLINQIYSHSFDHRSELPKGTVFDALENNCFYRHGDKN